MHNKFWLVDAKSTVTGARTLAYVGSSNWRADQQDSDDMLLRIADDGVHARYSEYWEHVKSRAASDQTRPPTDSSSRSPRSPRHRRLTTQAGTARTSPRVAGSDGHSPLAGGLKRLHVEMSGAQSGAWDFAGERRLRRPGARRHRRGRDHPDVLLRGRQGQPRGAPFDPGEHRHDRSRHQRRARALPALAAEPPARARCGHLRSPPGSASLVGGRSTAAARATSSSTAARWTCARRRMRGAAHGPTSSLPPR